MKAHIDNVQIIEQGGHPAFAVLPYDDYLQLVGQKDKDNDIYFPHEVAMMVAIDEFSPIKAWRKYLKMSQVELANKMGITQGAVAQIESSNSKPQEKTLKNAAKAMGIMPEQLSL